MDSSALVVTLVVALLVATALVVGLVLVARARTRRATMPPQALTPPAPGIPQRESGPARERVPEPRAPPAAPARVEPPAAAPPVELGGVPESADELAVLELEVPAPAVGRLQRLRTRLARSHSALGRGLLSLLSRGDIDDATWDEVEEVLLTADLGVGPTQELLGRLRTRVQVDGAQDPARVREILREELIALVDPALDRTVRATRVDGRPGVVLVVGVNGTGKTTTTGKIARLAVARGQTVLLGAADTFRAAAADQLQTWGDRVGAVVVRGPEGGDPASVAFEAVDVAQQAGLDTVIVDTAGRLHTKAGLMDELGKVKRVIEKKSPIDEVLLVLDATTGQNGLVQARVFADVVDVTGIVLTKLDGTARGGIVVAVQRELGVPVKLVGLGEGPDDLAPFEAAAFVDALLEG